MSSSAEMYGRPEAPGTAEQDRGRSRLAQAARKVGAVVQQLLRRVQAARRR